MAKGRKPGGENRPKDKDISKSNRETVFRYSLNHFARILIECNGNQRVMASATGLAVQGVYRRVEKHKRLRIIRDYFRKCMVDVAEENVYSSVMDGDINASYFVLETRNREKYSRTGPIEDQKKQVQEVTFILKQEPLKNGTCDDSITD